MSTESKVAIITGASRGIGRAIAERLAQSGCSIVIADMQGAEQTAERMKEAGTVAIGVAVDVSRAESVENMVKATTEHFGRIDILVNNAGITRDGLLLRMKEEDWDSVLAVNLKGAFHCCKAAARWLLKSPAGRIINIASVVGIRGNAGQANYSASKAGLIGLTKTLAREFAGRNVTVNAVAPGFIETDMTASLSESIRKALLLTIPLGRMGSAQEVAAAVGFLASEQAGYITGQVLTVDGGLSM